MHHTSLVLAILGGAVPPLIEFWIFSNIVSAIPTPDDVAAVGKSKGFVLFYKSVYTFLHACSGNLPHLIPSLRISAAPTPPPTPPVPPTPPQP